MDYTSYDIVATGKTVEERKPLEPGYYPAVCYGVVVTGTHLNYQNEPVTEVVILWELPSETYEYEGEMKCKTISETYRLSLTNSNLAKMLEKWRGRPFTEEELAGFSLNKIITKPCGLAIINKVSKNTGKTFSKIDSVMPLAKGTPVPRTMYHEPLCFNICDPRFDRDLMSELPEWIVKRIETSDEFNKVNPVAEAPIETVGDLPF